MRSARLVAFLLTLSPCLAEDAPSPATLRHELLHGDLSLRRKAAYAFWQLGEAAKDSIPALAQALRDEDAYVRDTCVRVLQRFDGALAPGIPGFLEALGDERPEVRREAACMLGGVGSLPAPAPDDLLAGMRVALGDEDAIVAPPRPSRKESTTRARRFVPPRSRPSPRSTAPVTPRPSSRRWMTPTRGCGSRR